ncbi:MAG: hypothetical protein ACTSWL_07970, partial [Promethearchaeota archaeon]
MKINLTKAMCFGMLTVLILQAVVIPSGTFPSNYNTINKTEGNVSNGINNDNSDQSLSTIDSNPPNFAQGDAPSSWWNETYQYRLKVEINNTDSFTRNQPIDLNLNFIAGHAYNNSIRIVYFYLNGEIETWEPIPCQVTDALYSGDFYDTATVTFVVSQLTSGQNFYYVYYNPEAVGDSTDYAGNYITSSQTGNQFSVGWKDIANEDYQLNLQENYGANSLIDNYGRNLHSDNSSSPGLTDYTK